MEAYYLTTLFLELEGEKNYVWNKRREITEC